MTTQTFLESLRYILVVQDSVITFETEFQLLESWDSLALISVISLADEHYSVELSPADILKCQTIGELCSLATGNIDS